MEGLEATIRVLYLVYHRPSVMGQNLAYDLFHLAANG
jgi:hypothetical protein